MVFSVTWLIHTMKMIWFPCDLLDNVKKIAHLKEFHLKNPNEQNLGIVLISDNLF